MFCKLGQRITDRFNGIFEIICNSEWYAFPKEIQRIMPTLMNSAEKPVILLGFGNLKCTRESFKKVN